MPFISKAFSGVRSRLCADKPRFHLIGTKGPKICFEHIPLTITKIDLYRSQIKLPSIKTRRQISENCATVVCGLNYLPE